MTQVIKITDIDAVRDQIMATDFLRTYYNGCVSLLKTFVGKSKKVSPHELNISEVELYKHKEGVQKKLKGGSGGAVEDVYYSKE